MNYKQEKHDELEPECERCRTKC